jgi:transcriptional regulator with XRE-family HTH domain
VARPVDSLFEDPMALGAALKKARYNADWTQGELADELGTTRERIGEWENGQRPDESGHQRRTFAIAVAVLTGSDELLAATGVAPLPKDVALQEIVARLTKLGTAVAALQKGEAETQRRLERLEQGV